MKRIIELAQEELSKEQDVLRCLKTDKELALSDALRIQGEIPVQEKKVEALDKALADLHKRYAYPECDTDEAISPAIPQVTQSVKPMGKVARNIKRLDIMQKVNRLDPTEYSKAFNFLDGLIQDID